MGFQQGNFNVKPTDDLHRLIRSLSKAEKRYFKLYASRYDTGEKNNYLKLFDAIEAQEEYAEELIKKLFGGEKFVKHLPSEKNYLYNLILDSLHLFHGEEAIEYKLKKRIHHASILFSRGLPDQSIRLLKKAKETALQQELYHVILEILQLEKQIITRNYYAGVTEEALEKIFEEEKQCISFVSEANEYWHLFSRFYRFHYRKGSSRELNEWSGMQEIIAHPLLADFSKARTLQTQLDFLHIHALYHFMAGEPAEALKYNRRYLDLLESRPDKIKYFSKRYMATLNNYLMDSLGLRKYDEVEKGIEKLRALPQQYPFYNARQIPADIFRLSSILELNVIIKVGNFITGLKKAQDIAKGLETYSGQIVKHNVLTIYYLLAYVHFGAEKYTDAIKWLSKIINDPEDTVLQDVQAFARIFALINHYELRNYDLLDYLYPSVTRYLTKRNKVFKAEGILLKYLKKLSGSAGSPRESVVIFKKLYAELLPLASDPMEQKAFEYFDLLAWVDSKIRLKPFREVVSEYRTVADSETV